MNTEKEQEALEWEGYTFINTRIKEGKLLIAAIAKIMSMYHLQFSKQEIVKELSRTANHMFKTYDSRESYSPKVKFIEFSKFNAYDDDGKMRTYPITINIHEIVLISRCKKEDFSGENSCYLHLTHTFANCITIAEKYEDVIKKIEDVLIEKK